MKKRGFTLIELLAVIIILGVLAMILIPVIQDLISNARYASAVNSVLNYVREANTQAAIDVGGFEGYSLDLSNNNRLESGVTDSELAKIKYKGKGPEYVYLHFTDDGKLVSDGHFCIWGYSIDYKMDTGASKSLGNNYCTGEVIVKEHYNIGEPIYYNVTTGKQCSEDAFLANIDEWGSHANFAYIGGKIITRSLEAMPTGLHSGCMKFYTISDDNENITLISASNIDEVGPDKYETDPNKLGERHVYWADIKDGEEDQNVKDFNNITNPQSDALYVLDTLKEYTKDWKTIPVSEDYTSTYNNGETEDSYTIPYKTDGYKARLITKAELEGIYDLFRKPDDAYGRVTDEVNFLEDYLDSNKHPYVYSKTETGVDTRGLYGYYTSDAMDANKMYVYSKGGYMWYKCDGKWIDQYNCSQAERKYFPYYYVSGTPMGTIYGIRPVITISREKLLDKEIYYAVPNIVNTDITYKKYESGTILYYNVTTGTECTKAEADNNLSYRHTPVGVKTGCMKFYTLADSEYSDRISLLLDHPITYTPVAWNEDAGMQTLFGATTLLEQMKEDTKDWVGTEEIENYVTNGYHNYANGSYRTEALLRQTVPFKDYGVKARLIKASEYDEVLHKTPAYNRSFSYADRQSVADLYSLNSPMGSYSYCSYGDSYDPNCNPYGTLGYNMSEISWLYADYQRNYSAGLNEPSAEYIDEYDGYTESYDTYSYKGGYWGMDLTKSNNGTGYGIIFMIDSPRWSDSGPHLYRPVVEIKKERFGNVTQKEAIEIAVESTTTFTSTLSNPTYSMMDSSIASVNSNGTITGLKIGVTQVKATDGTNIEYAKVVVNHKPNTYYDKGYYVYYNVKTGEECNTSEYRCTETSGCKQFQIFGETANSNYLMMTNAPSLEGYDEQAKYHWSAKYAIDKDPNAETKYGEMAYDHWYETLEWTANQTKDWKAEIPQSYVDYTTKEYVIPWSKPAYYENGQPVYARARSLQLEDVNGMYQNRTTNYGIWQNVYELLHNTGTTTIMYMGYTTTAYNTVGLPVAGYFTNMWSGYYGQIYHSAFISYFVVEVPKSKISNSWDMENSPASGSASDSNVIRSTSDKISWGGSSYYTYASQSSEDGGYVDVRVERECTVYSSGYQYCNNMNNVYGISNGHVHVVFNTSSGTQEVDFTVDIESSCGQVDMCGRTTPACDNEGDPINTPETNPGITSSTSVEGADVLPPVCTLNSVTQLTNGIQPSLTCTDETSEPTIRSQWNVRPVGASQFSDIGIVKTGTASFTQGVGYTKTVTPKWTTNDPISVPSYRDCYYFRYGAQDAAGNWSFYISDKCYYGFSGVNSGRLTN